MSSGASGGRRARQDVDLVGADVRIELVRRQVGASHQGCELGLESFVRRLRHVLRDEGGEARWRISDRVAVEDAQDLGLVDASGEGLIAQDRRAVAERAGERGDLDAADPGDVRGRQRACLADVHRPDRRAADAHHLVPRALAAPNPMDVQRTAMTQRRPRPRRQHGRHPPAIGPEHRMPHRIMLRTRQLRQGRVDFTPRVGGFSTHPTIVAADALRLYRAIATRSTRDRRRSGRRRGARPGSRRGATSARCRRSR